MSNTGRFDNIQYDQDAGSAHSMIKEAVISLEKQINLYLASPRAKALALTKLEESFMWVGKAIRDDQIVRNNTPKDAT